MIFLSDTLSTCLWKHCRWMFQWEHLRLRDKEKSIFYSLFFLIILSCYLFAILTALDPPVNLPLHSI